MRDCVLGEDDHCDNIRVERRANVVRLNVGNVRDLDLLGRVVDEDVECLVLLEVLVDDGLAVGVLAEIAWDEEALAALLLDGLLDILGAVVGDICQSGLVLTLARSRRRQLTPPAPPGGTR